MRVDTVLLKVASRCNLDCSYCYVYNMGDDSWRTMPKRMDPQVMAETCAQLGRLQVAQDHPFAVVLHGGEPLLLGAVRLGEIFSLLRSELGRGCSINVQTNGVLIDDTVLNLCAEHGVRSPSVLTARRQSTTATGGIVGGATATPQSWPGSPGRRRTARAERSSPACSP